MRTHWRITLVVGPLLIILAFLAALPCLHRLVYSEALPASAVERTMERMRPTPDGHGGQQSSPICCEATLPVDRQIDELGAPDHIRTEADALAYVKALVERWGPAPKEANHLAEFEQRLARAEYAAVHDPEKRIPESQVVKVFNGLMDEWQMPRWTRISVADLHAFRTVYANTIYPRSVVRLPDESIAPSCRPTEALFLLNTLDMRGSVPPEIRKVARDNSFPWSFLRLLKWSAWSSPPTETSVQNPVESDHKYTEYLTCRRKYFSNHQITVESVVNHLFAQLGFS